MQHLFAHSFGNETEAKKIENMLSHLPDIDNMIAVAAPEWPIDKIAKIDLAILRLSLFEMTERKETPIKVVIDEAVELAKAYGNPNSAKFINGVLGTIVQTL
ncbi:MAG: transcription antitermination factor NusB [Candidatus Gottesmanbacteria bacterium]